MMARITIPAMLISLVLLSACSEGSLDPANGTAPVSVSATFTTAGTPAALGKGSGFLAADSLHIDSALVVFSRIEFESEVHHSDSSMNHEMEMELTFMGPFMIHVRNSDPITFTSQVLPAGTYNSIKFRIHKLSDDDHHYDSDDSRHMYVPSTGTPYVGSSIIVWGHKRENGIWTPFTFETNIEAEYRIRGSFVVDETIQTIPVTLNFNIGRWFVDPATGGLLDPSDNSSANRFRIHEAIQNSFENGSCGRDDNHDGHPDDNPHYDDSY